MKSTKVPTGNESLSPSPSRKTRYAVACLSNRGNYHFLLPLLGKHKQPEAGDFSAIAEVVGVYDFDADRVRAFCEKHNCKLTHYTEKDGIEGMLRDCQPDVLLVAGPDHTHCEHIIAGLKHGLRVVVEKPMVINSDEVRRVLEAERQSTGSITVAHNARYKAAHRKLKSMILEGKVGRVTNIEFAYNLDVRHGASYFHRWNRSRSLSGGLSIHKSVHHIDLINWLLSDKPETVFAFGALNYYGPNGAHRPRNPDGKALDLESTLRNCPYYKKNRGEYTTGSGTTLNAPDDWTLPNTAQYPKPIYIYDPEIDIEDTYSTVIRYQNGAFLSYSLNFSTPLEGYSLGINGTGGRLEFSHYSQPQEDGSSKPAPQTGKINYYPLFGGKEVLEIIPEAGSHGGSDPILRRDLFDQPGQESLKLGIMADAYNSGLAVAAGEAMWRSALDGKAWRLADLLGDDY